MAMKKRYYTVNGEIIGEQATGQERIDYLTDPLGNVTATVDQNAKVLNRYTYKPFGEVLSKEGTAPDPSFLWVGAHGYRQTGKKYADVYIRRRTYDTSGGRWTTRDPTGYRGGINRYQYVRSDPVASIDPSGLLRITHGPPHIGYCGEIRVRFTFHLDPGETNGYIVQKVRLKREKYQCDVVDLGLGMCFCLIPTQIENFECAYYEAWQVSGGQIHPAPYDDWEYVFTDRCMRGKHIWDAQVKFIPNYQLGSGWTRGCCEGYPRDLPCFPGHTGQIPSGWNDGDLEHIERWMSAEWNCCPILRKTGPYGIRP